MTPAERAIADRVDRGLPAKIEAAEFYDTVAGLLSGSLATAGQSNNRRSGGGRGDTAEAA